VGPVLNGRDEMHTLYDEIGGELEQVPAWNVARAAVKWHRRGYAEVYIDDASLPAFDVSLPED
jgi:hypothetical protein